MPRSKFPIDPYGKQTSAPLPTPNTSSAVNYVQIPENVMWLSGDRGFVKRPGSEIAARYVRPAVARSPTTGLPEYLITDAFGFTAVVTPDSFKSATTNSERYTTPDKMIVGCIDRNPDSTHNWTQALMFYENIVGSLSTSSLALTRNLDHSLATYSFNSGVVDSTTILGDVFAGSNTYSQLINEVVTVKSRAPNKTQLQNFSPMFLTGGEETATITSTPNTNKVVSGSRARVDSASVNGDTFWSVGTVDLPSNWLDNFAVGDGSHLWGFDGYRNYVAGAPIVQMNSAVLAAGTLTGTYMYFWTARIRLPSGEIIESEPTSTSTLTPAAQGVAISAFSGSTKTYRMTEWTTTTTGTTSIVTLIGAHDLQFGEYVTFFISGARAVRQVTGVSGQDITLGSSVTLAGTTFLSTGGGLTLYRTVAGGSTFYRATEMTQAGALAGYTDTAADSTLTVQYTSTATLRNPPPTSVTSFTAHSGRLFVLAGNTVWYTSGLSNYYYDPAMSFDVPGGTARGICSLNGILYIVLSDRVYYATGEFDDATTFKVSLLTDRIGALNNKSVLVFADSVWLVSQTRTLVQITGTTISVVGAEVATKELENNEIVPALFAWPTKGLLLVCCTEQVLRQGYLGGYFYEASGPSRTLVYDSTQEKWSVWGVDVSQGCFEMQGDLLYLHPRSVDYRYASVEIMRLSDDFLWADSGVPFTARYYSEWYDAGAPAVHKSFDRAQIFSTDTTEAGGQGFKLTVRTERDWQPGLTVDTFTDLTDFKVDTGYAEQAYDSQPYGDPELSEKVLSLSNQKCKSLRLVLENSEPNRNFAINAVGVEVNTKYVNMKDE
jgi:hypothetical protein